MKTFNFLAFDIGATSGRALLTTFCNGNITIKEIYRFPNSILELNGKYCWNVYSIYEHLKKALMACGQAHITINSIGIDTWGVDFGYLAEDGSLLGLPRSYRDPYTTGITEEVFALVSKNEMYRRTGIQIMNFNSVFQLYAARKEHTAAFHYAKGVLFIPDLLAYLLTGKKVCEYTIASTTQMLNPKTRKMDCALLDTLGINPHLFSPLVEPGTVIGKLRKAIADETGVGEIPVIAVAEHDTASAIAAVPATDRHFAYLSSGTWSLMGIETDRPIISDLSLKNEFTNEGGIEGTTCFLSNITGMWLLEQCRKHWQKEGKDYSYQEIEKMVLSEIDFLSIINPNDSSFANPNNMVESIVAYCRDTNQNIPENDAQVMSCIYHSLASKYKDVLKMLQDLAPFKIETLHIIGGGSLNNLMNRLTANAIGMPVVAGPSEATAIGNTMIQAKHFGLVTDRWEMRQVIADAFSVRTFIPEI